MPKVRLRHALPLSDRTSPEGAPAIVRARAKACCAILRFRCKPCLAIPSLLGASIKPCLSKTAPSCSPCLSAVVPRPGAVLPPLSAFFLPAAIPACLGLAACSGTASPLPLTPGGDINARSGSTASLAQRCAKTEAALAAESTICESSALYVRQLVQTSATSSATASAQPGELYNATSLSRA